MFLAMFSLVSTRTPVSIPAELLSSLVPQHVLVPGVVPPQVQDFAILLPEPHEIFVPLLSSPSRSPRMAARPSGDSAMPPGFVSSANLLREVPC